MTKEHGTMDFDFRKRCVVKVSAGDIEYDRIYYGLGLMDYVNIFEDGSARPMFSPYADLSVGGRTRPIEDEYKLRKHFFNKRIRTHEESIGGQTVQTNRDTDRVRTCDGVGGASSVAEAAPAEGGVGSSGETEGKVT